MGDSANKTIDRRHQRVNRKKFKKTKTPSTGKKTPSTGKVFARNRLAKKMKKSSE